MTYLLASLFDAYRNTREYVSIVADGLADWIRPNR